MMWVKDAALSESIIDCSGLHNSGVHADCHHTPLYLPLP
jgi:hypothetical protein